MSDYKVTEPDLKSQDYSNDQENDGMLSKQILRDEIEDESIRKQIPPSCNIVEVIYGQSIGEDMSRIKTNQKESNHHVPSTR